jgi:hypothetical protein
LQELLRVHGGKESKGYDTLEIYSSSRFALTHALCGDENMNLTPGHDSGGPWDLPFSRVNFLS